MFFGDYLNIYFANFRELTHLCVCKWKECGEGLKAYAEGPEMKGNRIKYGLWVLEKFYDDAPLVISNVPRFR